MLPNPDLKPERGLQADVSAAWRHEKATAQVTGFYGLYENLIAYRSTTRPCWPSRTTSRRRGRAGLEVEGAFAPAKWLEAQASYTFMATQNLKDDPRYYLKSLPYRPGTT